MTPDERFRLYIGYSLLSQPSWGRELNKLRWPSTIMHVRAVCHAVCSHVTRSRWHEVVSTTLVPPETGSKSARRGSFCKGVRRSCGCRRSDRPFALTIEDFAAHGQDLSILATCNRSHHECGPQLVKTHVMSIDDSIVGQSAFVVCLQRLLLVQSCTCRLPLASQPVALARAVRTVRTTECVTCLLFDNARSP